MMLTPALRRMLFAGLLVAAGFGGLLLTTSIALAQETPTPEGATPSIFDGPTPEPTATPLFPQATPTLTPTPTSIFEAPTTDPTPTPLFPSPPVIPTVTAEPALPEPGPTPDPERTPTPTPTPEPTATPSPTATAEPTPTPEPTAAPELEGLMCSATQSAPVTAFVDASTITHAAPESERFVVHAETASGELELFRGSPPATGIIGFPVPAGAGIGIVELVLAYEIEPGVFAEGRCQVRVVSPPATPKPSPSATATARAAASDIAASSESAAAAPEQLDRPDETDAGAVAGPAPVASVPANNRKLLGVVGALLLMFVSAAALIRHLLNLP